ncbi:cupredoxin domain-containing protein [Neobacillus sp. Marseille-QA0830]
MNIFFIITAVIVAAASGFSIYLLYHYKTKMSKTAGMLASIAVSAVTGLLSGAVLGLMSGEIFLVTGISLLLGFFVGFLAGHPAGLPSILLSSIAGLLGAITGAILGILLQFINPAILLGILLGLYVVIIGMVLLYLLAETNEKIKVQTEELTPFAILVAGILLISLFLFLYSSDLVEIPAKASSTETQTQPEKTSQEIDARSDTNPKIKILVTEKGYSPNVIRVKRGSLVELQIDNPFEDSCYATFNLPDFNIQNASLKLGTTSLSFTADKAGEFTYSCGMNMLKGTVIVE